LFGVNQSLRVKEIALDTPAGAPGKSFILHAIRHGRSRERRDQESARGDRENLIVLINCGVFQTGRARSPVAKATAGAAPAPLSSAARNPSQSAEILIRARFSSVAKPFGIRADGRRSGGVFKMGKGHGARTSRVTDEAASAAIMKALESSPKGE